MITDLSKQKDDFNKLKSELVVIKNSLKLRLNKDLEDIRRNKISEPTSATVAGIQSKVLTNIAVDVTNQLQISRLQ